MSYPDYDEYFTLEVLTEDNCLITHCTDDECNYLGQLIDTSENSYSFSKVFSDLKGLYETDFFPRLREITDMEDSDDDTMFNVVNYLYWAQRNNLDLKFTLNDDDKKWIEADAHKKLWYEFL